MTYIRSSSLGLPIRSLVAGLLGEPPTGPPPAVSDAAHEGTRLEHPVKTLLPFPVLDDQREVELRHLTATGRPVIVRGHTDGRRDENTTLEVKTVTDKGLVEWRIKRWEAKPSWAWQVSSYCEAMGTPRVLMAVFARDTGELDLWEADVPRSSFEICDRLEEILDWVGRGELPPSERYFGWDPWAHVHRLEAEEDAELAEVLDEYDRLKHAADPARLAELKDRLLFLMGDRRKVSAGGVEASFSAVSSERFDTDAFKRQHPELYAQFLRKSESTRLVVRRVS